MYDGKCIFQDRWPDDDAFAMQTLPHLLYVNLNMTQDELKKCGTAILECRLQNRSTAQQVLMFCYNELPRKYVQELLALEISAAGNIKNCTTS